MRTPIETVVVFAPLVAGYAAAAQGPGGATGGTLILVAAAVVSLLLATRVLRTGGQTWGGLGLARPMRPGMFILWCLATLVVVALIGGILRNAFLFMSLGREGVEQADTPGGNAAPLAVAIAGVWIVSALGEELLFRGYLMDRLLRVRPGGKESPQLAVFLCAVLYALAHLPRGGLGVVHAGAVGLAYGAMYFGSGRSLWVTVIAHGVLDTLTLMGAGATTAEAG